MPLLASATLDKLAKVPTTFWLYCAAAILGIIALVFIARYLQGMNKIVLSIIVLVVVSVVGFNWVYERNEPAFLTPAIDVLAQFLPTKGSYQQTQKKESGNIKDAKGKPAEKKKP